MNGKYFIVVLESRECSRCLKIKKWREILWAWAIRARLRPLVERRACDVYFKTDILCCWLYERIRRENKRREGTCERYPIRACPRLIVSGADSGSRGKVSHLANGRHIVADPDQQPCYAD
ncbi:MAG: hypothetical protein JNL84_14485 [Candidatus Accumulibacter sp.]|nr:hypothetical protein [Accumulibacter sp.]